MPKRTERLQIKLTKAEMKLVKVKAREAGMTVSAWARMRLIYSPFGS